MEVAVRECSTGENFSSIVDEDITPCQLNTRVRRNQSVQVDHGATVLPQKRANFSSVVDPRSAYDLSAGIDRQRITGLAKIPKISHRAIFPEKCVMELIARKVGLANNLPGIV